MIGALDGAVAQLGERFNGIEEARGSNPLSSIVGPWRSWERVSMALRRSWVRIPLGPHNYKQKGSRSSRLSTSEPGERGASPALCLWSTMELNSPAVTLTTCVSESK